MTQIALLLCTVAAVERDHAQVDMWRLFESGFVPQNRLQIADRTCTHWRRREDPAIASIEVFQLRLAMLGERRTNPATRRRLVLGPLHEGGFRNLPAGDCVIAIRGPDRDELFIDAGEFTAEGFIAYFPTGGLATMSWRAGNRQRDRDVLEGTLRSAVARALGQELTIDGWTLFDGRKVPTKSTLRAGPYVQLRTWAAARGITLNINELRGVASFVVDGQDCIVPLAANEIKVGPTWRSLVDFVCEVDGEWYVPVATFELWTLGRGAMNTSLTAWSRENLYTGAASAPKPAAVLWANSSSRIDNAGLWRSLRSVLAFAEPGVRRIRSDGVTGLPLPIRATPIWYPPLVMRRLGAPSRVTMSQANLCQHESLGRTQKRPPWWNYTPRTARELPIDTPARWQVLDPPSRVR